MLKTMIGKAALGLAAVLAVGQVTLTATPASAKQCVWNKAGFILEVH